MNPHAARHRQIDECLSRAMAMMNSPRGQEAAEGRYYTEMFGWLHGQLERGIIPKGIPAKLLEEWKAIGAFRKGRAA